MTPRARILWLIGWLAATGVVALVCWLPRSAWQELWQELSTSDTFYQFVLVGFLAQLIDGLLGMGFGVVTAISLMSLGMNPAAVSASIHTAEMFSSGAAGYHHFRLGNVNRRLFKALILPGVLGAVGGAFVLSYFGGEPPGDWVRPVVAVYLLLLGLRILGKALQAAQTKRAKVRHVGWLAAAGGFLDSFGGGGWGPLVTSTLIARGRTPQYVIGTVSVTEFFVTLASSLTFVSVIGVAYWPVVLGLIVGGLLAAPLAARLAGRIPVRWMLLGVGLMVVFWSLWRLYRLFA
ncbi:sulfite exporter TauE/SafE family protein [Hymenobacter sp. B81]|uniref:sulfite exporter TauE/SafE family protein n=1 Tax=Hymenobacter sp. B81 TaxID=3344878 RepID=UPI0037DC31E5